MIGLYLCSALVNWVIVVYSESYENQEKSYENVCKNGSQVIMDSFDIIFIICLLMVKRYLYLTNQWAVK